MCGIKHGHDYGLDAEREMNGDGDRWFSGLSDWLGRHWLILVVAAGALAWVIRVEVFAQAGGRFTTRDAAELEQRWEERFDALPPDTYEKYIDARFDTLEQQIQRIQDDVEWIREHLEQ